LIEFVAQQRIARAGAIWMIFQHVAAIIEYRQAKSASRPQKDRCLKFIRAQKPDRFNFLTGS
jgi:hypothetical protein